MTVPGMIIGALAGGVVTVAVTLLWPKNKLRVLRPLAAAGVGFGVAYLLMTLVH